MPKIAAYVDLFLLPLPRKNMVRYRRSARVFARFVKKHGALDYREFLGDDLHPKGMTPFTRYYKLKSEEVLVGSYVLYRNRAHRDRVNKKMMFDPEMKEGMQSIPFDMRRMCYGGFKTIIMM
jgi:uncharacterized protein YbaA (DUF1428 family)